MSLPSDQLPLGEGLDPAGKPGAPFFIDTIALETVERDGPEWKFEDARFIEEAIQEPDAIFQGLRRVGQQEGLCYSVRPTRDPDIENDTGPPCYGQVFLVYVRVGMGYVVFDWAWREEDENSPGHPAGWQGDFTRRLWHRI